MDKHLDPTVRHDAVLLFDVQDGNPNGDPDRGNRPRQDQETSHGLITDVALKRKIRDTVAIMKGDVERYQIFIQAGEPLNPRIEESYTAHNIGLDAKEKKKNPSPDDVAAARRWLCDRYYDIRMFGAVLGTGKTTALGRLTGPTQITISRSLHPIDPAHHAITRVAPTTAKAADDGKQTEMGGKWTVPYALYRTHIHYSAALGHKTGVTDEDLDVLYRAITYMFDHTRAAGRGEMTIHSLNIFSHTDAFGLAPAHTLTNRITVDRTTTEHTPARSITDYKIEINDTNLPQGITLTTLI